MGCGGDRKPPREFRAEQLWDYINLNDFKSNSCLTPVSYFFVWIFMFVSIAVYVVDSFTAVNLLIFSRWASEIKPSIPIPISRWIFAGCIIASFVLLVFRWIRTVRVMRSGAVAESYLDPLAVRVQSVRVFGGRGWKRFLVFAELTKSKKGADYVALFSYFSFEACLRIIFADGPRQVVNAVTLYSVMQISLIPQGKNAAPPGTSPVAQFFINIEALAEKNTLQVVILLGMLFTLVIWVISALSLIISVILYLIFLWHHIPSEDGSLKAFCRRKINTRLERIVKRKVNKALAKGLVLQDRKPTQPVLSTGPAPPPLKPTLPSVTDLEVGDLSPPLSRQDTMTTLPPYSRSGTALPEEQTHFSRQPTLPNLGFTKERPPFMRTETDASSFSDSATLIGHAAPTGYSSLDYEDEDPMPPMPGYGQTRSQSPLARPPNAQNRSTPGGLSFPMEGPGRRMPNAFEHSNSPYSQPPSSLGRRTPGGPGGPPYGPTRGDFRPSTPSEQPPRSGSVPPDPAWTPGGNPNLNNLPRSMTPGASSGPPGQGQRSRIPANNAIPRSMTPRGPEGTSNGESFNRSQSPATRSPPRALQRLATDISNSNNSINRNDTSTSGSNTGGYVAFNPNRSESPHVERSPTSPTYRNFARPGGTQTSRGPANISQPSLPMNSEEFSDRSPQARSYRPPQQYNYHQYDNGSF